MKIQLKNVQIQDRQSEETTAFTASLYINNHRVGYAKNSGKGGCTDYGVDDYHDEKAKELLKEAEEFCLSLDPLKLPSMDGEKPITIPMNLEHFIDEMVDEVWDEKEKKRFKNKIKKDQGNGLLIGNDKQYRKITWSKKNSTYSIEELLASEIGKLSIKTTVKKYKKTMLPEERILNTNIPADLLT